MSQSVEAAIRCACGHPQDDHYPPPSGKGSPECWVLDDGLWWCTCPTFMPAAHDGGAGGLSVSIDERDERRGK